MQNTSAPGCNLHPPTVELDWTLPRLQHLDEEDLLQLAVQAARLEFFAFRLRGAVASELRRRIAHKLPGGRGRRDAEGKGIRACFKQLAAEIGVSVVTLTTDARIHDAFFSHAEETLIARDNSLAREFYTIALAAPDPLAAIHAAEEKAAGNTCGSYTREEFRRHVRELKCAAKDTDFGTNKRKAATSTSLPRQRVLVTGAARYALSELIKASNSSAEQIVADALIARYHAQVESTSHTAATKPHGGRHNHRAQRDDDPSHQRQPSLLG